MKFPTREHNTRVRARRDIYYYSAVEKCVSARKTKKTKLEGIKKTPSLLLFGIPIFSFCSPRSSYNNYASLSRWQGILRSDMHVYRR